MKQVLWRVRGEEPHIESGVVRFRSRRASRILYILFPAFVVLGGVCSSSFADEEPAGAATKHNAGGNPALSRKTIQSKLLARTDLEVKEATLEEVMKLLAEQHGVPIRLDPEGLKKAGRSAGMKVSLSIRNWTLNRALRKIFTGSGLHHVIDGGAIVITDVHTAPAAKAAVNAAAAKEDKPAREAKPAQVVAGDRRILAVAGAADEQQYLVQFRPIAGAELQFVRRTCDPTPEQRRLLAAEAASALLVVAKEYAEAMHKIQRGDWNSGKSFPQPREQILAGFAVAVPAILTAGQAARYADEAARREANRRQVTIRGVVVKLDQELRLSTDQRERLCKSLAEHWNASWIQFQPNSDEGLPPIPDSGVAPILNAAQLKVWKEISRNTSHRFGISWRRGLFRMQGAPGPAEEGDDLDLALKELAGKKRADREQPEEAN